MNIEIIEFYENFRDEPKEILLGSLHVRFVDLGIDLRGIFVSRRKNFWIVNLPGNKTKNEDGTDVRYPIFSFTDREKTKELQQAVREKAIPFIQERLTKPKQIQSQAKDEDRQKPRFSASHSAIAKKEYIDLPPRKFSNQNKGAYVRKSR